MLMKAQKSFNGVKNLLDGGKFNDPLTQIHWKVYYACKKFLSEFGNNFFKWFYYTNIFFWLMLNLGFFQGLKCHKLVSQKSRILFYGLRMNGEYKKAIITSPL